MSDIFASGIFGNESISRQQATNRLVAISANRLHTAPVDIPTTQDTNGSSPTLDGPAETPANGKVASTDIQILMLPSGRLPWRSMLLSILTHGLILSLLLSIRLPQRRNRMIDFDITYYKMSESFPNVAPKQQKELSDSLLESRPEPADFQTDKEVRIQPIDSSQSEIVIKQPNVRQMSALPKLQLPNILLLQTSKMDPGREPLVVSADVLRHLAMDVQQPQSLGNLPENSTQTLATRQPASPLPQLAAPAEPASEALPVSQVAGQFARLQQRSAPLPYAAPPVEDSTLGFQIEAMPTQGPNLLVFSARPAVPKGELRCPRPVLQDG